MDWITGTMAASKELVERYLWTMPRPQECPHGLELILFASHGLSRKVVAGRGPTLTAAAFWKELMRILETRWGSLHSRLCLSRRHGREDQSDHGEGAAGACGLQSYGIIWGLGPCDMDRVTTSAEAREMRGES